MYKCIVFGGNGNIGRTVIDNLLKSDKYNKITVFSRKKLKSWDELEEKQKNKINYINIQSFDFLNTDNYLETVKQYLNNEIDYNTIFCCLGGKDDSEYENIDYKLSIKISTLCEELNIAHFSVISAENSNSNSDDKFLKFRGKMEEELLKKNIKCISIFKTDKIINKEDPPFLYCFIFFFYRCYDNSIECQKLGKAMVVNDLDICEQLTTLSKNGEEDKIEKMRYFTNNDIKRLSLKKI